MSRVLESLVRLLAIFLSCRASSAAYQWSFQQRIQVPEAGSTYGKIQTGHDGRGFETMITGYDASTSSPGIYVHTTDRGQVGLDGQVIWSQQAKLVAKDFVPGGADQFGSYMVSLDQTLIVSSPKAGNGRGYVYIFNGTLRHWSQVQKLTALDGNVIDNFGTRLAMHGDKVVITAPGAGSNMGAAYVYARQGNTLFWSRQGKLVAADGAKEQFFAAKVAVHGNIVVATANNDDFIDDRGAAGIYRSQSGSAYIFQLSGTQWSQQQKLVALDMQNYLQKKNIAKTDQTYGPRFFGVNVGVNSDYIAVSTRNVWQNKTNRGMVYVFNMTDTTKGQFSLQQRLFYSGSTMVNRTTYEADLYMDYNNTLIATTTGPLITTSYIFNSSGAGQGWTLMQELSPCDYAIIEENLNGANIPIIPENEGRDCTSFSNPVIVGGNLYHTSVRTDNSTEVQIRTKYRSTSCLKIWMSDHFHDGWDIAVLTVRAPDTSNDTFHPHCDQPDPFYVRYCPRAPDEEGDYIIKVFAPTRARFFWEISWRVMIENTGEWYLGDFATTMHFNYNNTLGAFSVSYAENLIDLNGACHRCTTVARQSWTELQVTGNSAFWPLVVTGSPYYISDYSAYTLASLGKVCENPSGTLITGYECYQTLTDGVYILRLGGGLFGNITGYPYDSATWSGCGMNGTARDQFVFAIKGGECHAVQKHTYTWRCDQPPPVDTASFSSTPAPTGGGTQAPSQSTFGSPYKQFGMYSMVDQAGEAPLTDDDGSSRSDDRSDDRPAEIADTLTTRRRLAEAEERAAEERRFKPKETPSKIYPERSGSSRRRRGRH